MGRIKWFRSKNLLMVLRGVATVITALARFIARQVPDNGVKGKGGGSQEKRTMRKK